MADNTVTMKAPKSDTTIIVQKDMVEYYSKMGYTKVGKIDTKPIINNVKLKKEKQKMANHTGTSGLVKVGTNTVAEVRSFTINTTAELLEDTTLTDTSKSSSLR